MTEIALNTLKSVKIYPNTPYFGQNPKFSKNPNLLVHPLCYTPDKHPCPFKLLCVMLSYAKTWL